MADSEDQSQPAGERLIYDLNAAPDPASGSGNNLVGNLLVAQSGGPTAVINASVAGVIQEAGRHLDNIEEIYGGLNGFFDYGPLGVELRKNIKDAWWEDMVLSLIHI